MPSDYEQMLKSCSSMDDIRKKAAREGKLKDEWAKSLQSMVTLLNDRTERVMLKGKLFKTAVPAADEDIKSFESQIRQCVDPELTIGKYTKNDLKNLHKYNEFMATHCRERNYIFQVRKCDNLNCCTAVRTESGNVPLFLPDPLLQPDKEHYKPLSDVLGCETTEADMPSANVMSVAKVAEEQQGCPNTMLTGQNVRTTLSCFVCGKPRCIYSKKALTFREERGLKCLLEKYTYSCGSMITPDVVAQGELTWNEEEEFEVEQILDYAEEDGTEFFLIKWKGWSHAHDSWEPKQNIDCEGLIAEFERKNKMGIVKTGTKRKFDEIKVFDDRESKRSRIDKLFGKLSSCKQMITPIKLISLTSPDKGKKCYRGLVSCEGLRAPKFNNTTKALNKRSKAYKLRQTEIKKALQEWENHLNAISTDPASIAVENVVDLEGPPENFVYINDYKPGEGITIPNDPIIGCECSDCVNEKKHCCAAQFGAEYAYYSNKRLRIEAGRPVYECNKRCKCGPECSNRVVQQGRKHKVCIFRTSNGRGWGVKAQQRIKKGTFVMEYVGEVISNEEAETRGKMYDSVGRTYLFDLDFNDDDCPFTVDAAVYGNVSHFVNHSCDPNLEVYSVWINTLDPRLPRIALFSRRDIEKGEELTFDYMSSKAHSPFVEDTEDTTCLTSQTNDVGSEIADKMPADMPSLIIDSVTTETQPGLVVDLTSPEPQPDLVVDLTDSESQSTDCEIVDMAEKQSESVALSSSPKKVKVKSEAYRMVCQCGAKNCRKFVF